jgi:hypothetical protein
MARTSKDFLLKGVHGKIGDQIVVKQYADKTVITSMPDMSGVKPSPLQKLVRKNFSEAVKYAQSINRNPVKKKKYAKKITDGQDVYHFAIQEYFRD